MSYYHTRKITRTATLKCILKYYENLYPTSRSNTGTQEGPILIFSSGSWRDQSDRFPGHPHSVSALAKVDENMVLTGSSDGIIRLVNVHPNRLLGAIGDHDEYPIERLVVSHDKRTLASCSHDNTVKLWDIGYFWDEDEEEEEGEGRGQQKKEKGRIVSYQLRIEQET